MAAIIDTDNCEVAYFDPDPVTSPINDMILDISAATTTAQDISFLDHVTVWSQQCSFSASLTPTQSFLSFNDAIFILTLSSSNVYEIGDYS